MELMEVNKEQKDTQWSWTKFWIGKLSNKFIAFVVSTTLIFIALFHNGWTNPNSETVILIVWGAVTFIYMLHGAIDTAVANTKINAELKAGASISKNIPGGK